METSDFMCFIVGLVLIAIYFLINKYVSKRLEKKLNSYINNRFNDDMDEEAIDSLFSADLTAAAASRLIQEGADPTARDDDGFTPFMYPICADAVPVLAAAGTDPLAVDNQGWNMVHHIAKYQDPPTDLVRAIIKLAHDSHLDLDALTSSDGHSALLLAVHNDAEETIEQLLKYGANPNTTPHENDIYCGAGSALKAASQFNKNTISAMLLLAAGASDPEIDDHFTPLHHAAAQGNVAEIQHLTQSGFTVDSPDLLKCTPLMYAAFFGHLAAVDTLIAIGANVNARSIQEKGFLVSDLTPLMIATRRGYADIVKSLLTAGAEVDGRSDGNHTPLMYACRNDYIDIAQILLDAGANPNASDADNNPNADRNIIFTPLLQCGENKELKKLLVRYGAKNKGKFKISF